jgi:hypothetical protein
MKGLKIDDFRLKIEERNHQSPIVNLKSSIINVQKGSSCIPSFKISDTVREH